MGKRAVHPRPSVTVDLVIFTIGIYLSGAENSWLFPILLVRVADQTPTTYRRCVMFTALGPRKSSGQ